MTEALMQLLTKEIHNDYNKNVSQWSKSQVSELK